MVHRVLVTRQEAAAALAMSLRHFQRHVQPHLPCVYSGQLRLYRPQDLERWAEREARSAERWNERDVPSAARERSSNGRTAASAPA